jgi:hypothetical protein
MMYFKHSNNHLDNLPDFQINKLNKFNTMISQLNEKGDEFLCRNEENTDDF